MNVQALKDDGKNEKEKMNKHDKIECKLSCILNSMSRNYKIYFISLQFNA